MDRLSVLPEELIDNVCGHLPEKHDIQQLRLSCKRLHESSQHAFDDRHFKVVRCKLFVLSKCLATIDFTFSLVIIDTTALKANGAHGRHEHPQELGKAT